MIDLNVEYKIKFVSDSNGFSIKFEELTYEVPLTFEIQSVIFESLRFKTNTSQFELICNGEKINYVKDGDTFLTKVPTEGTSEFWLTDGDRKSQVESRTIKFWGTTQPTTTSDFEIKSVIFSDLRFTTNLTNFKFYFKNEQGSVVEVPVKKDGENLLVKSPYKGKVEIWLETETGKKSKIETRQFSF